MNPASSDLIRAMSASGKRMHIKIEFFDNQMNYIGEVTQRTTKENLGQISIDLDRPVNRSFSFSLNNYKNEFDWGDEKTIWIDKRIKLFIGFELWDGTVEYVPQGVFIISEPTSSHDTSGAITSISGQDKMYLMTDTRGKFLNELTIEEGTDIAVAIKLIAGAVGETLFNFDETDKKVPYELTYNSQDNRYNAIKELADLAECIIYYDVHGYLRLKKVDLNEANNNPVVWKFKYGDPDEKFYSGSVRKMDESQLANVIRVVGGSGQTATVTYDLKVDEDATQTIFYSDVTEEDFDLGVKTNLVYKDGLQLEKDGVDLIFNEDTEESFSIGTLVNVSPTEDGLELREGVLEGHRITNPIPLTDVVLYGRSYLTWNYKADINTSLKIESRVSVNGTWSEWVEQTFNSQIKTLEVGQSTANTLVQFKQTFTRNSLEDNRKIKLNWFKINISSTFKSSGEYLSHEIQYDAGENEETKYIYLTFEKNVPEGTNILFELRYLLDDTWSGWTKVDNDSVIVELPTKRKISDFKFQHREFFSSTEKNMTPHLKAITINSDVEEYWKGNPYSIQRIGEVSYFHNGGNPDPLITLKEEAVWRAKYSLMESLGYSEQVSISISPHYLLEAGDAIEIEDDKNAVNGKYLITSLSIPINPDLMNIECLKYKKVIDNWNFI